MVNTLIKPLNYTYTYNVENFGVKEGIIGKNKEMYLINNIFYNFSLILFGSYQLKY